MEEQRNVKWIIAVSIVTFLFSVTLIPSLTLIGPIYPPREPSILDTFWYIINRVDVLFFIATITTGTLSTTGFPNKDLTYKLTIYLFTISMGLFFLSFTKLLFTIP